jgi:hypothetical protein
LGLRGTRRQGIGEDYITRNLVICTHHQILFGDQIEENEMGVTRSTYGERRDAYRILVDRSEGRRPLGRLMRIKEDNIKMDLKDVGSGAWAGSG